MDEEETRQRRWRAQDIEDGREDGDNPMEGEGERSGISNPPRLADTKKGKCRTGERGKGEGIRRKGQGERDKEKGIRRNGK